MVLGCQRKCLTCNPRVTQGKAQSPAELLWQARPLPGRRRRTLRADRQRVSGEAHTWRRFPCAHAARSRWAALTANEVAPALAMIYPEGDKVAEKKLPKRKIFSNTWKKPGRSVHVFLISGRGKLLGDRTVSGDGLREDLPRSRKGRPRT